MSSRATVKPAYTILNARLGIHSRGFHSSSPPISSSYVLSTHPSHAMPYEAVPAYSCPAPQRLSEPHLDQRRRSRSSVQSLRSRVQCRTPAVWQPCAWAIGGSQTLGEEEVDGYGSCECWSSPNARYRCAFWAQAAGAEGLEVGGSC